MNGRGDTMRTEFGTLGTAADLLMYEILLEQRKTNELLQSFLEQNKKPEPEPEVAPVKLTSKNKEVSK